MSGLYIKYMRHSDHKKIVGTAKCVSSHSERIPRQPPSQPQSQHSQCRDCRHLWNHIIVSQLSVFFFCLFFSRSSNCSLPGNVPQFLLLMRLFPLSSLSAAGSTGCADATADDGINNGNNGRRRDVTRDKRGDEHDG